MKCRVLFNFTHKSKRYQAGSEAEFSPGDIKNLKHLGLIEPLQNTSISSSDGLAKNRMIHNAENRGYK